MPGEVKVLPGGFRSSLRARDRSAKTASSNSPILPVSTPPSDPFAKQFAICFLDSICFIDTELFQDLAVSKPPFKIHDPESIKKQKERYPENLDLHEDLDSLLNDNAIYLGQFNWWQKALATVALYHTLEIQRAKMLSVVAPGMQAAENFHAIKRVEAFLRDRQIDHGKLADADEVDTLRLIANNIKHHGDHVGAVLGMKPGFVEGEFLAIDKLDIEVHARVASTYLYSLRDSLRAFLEA